MSTQNKKSELYFLLGLLGVILVLAFFIFMPFLYALALALIFATVFKPLYERIKKFFKGQKEVASLVTIFAVTIFVLVPLIFLGLQMIEEVQSVYSVLTQDGEKETFLVTIDNLANDIKESVPFLESVSLDIEKYTKQGVGWVVKNLALVFSSIAQLILNIGVFLMCLYYLLKDGSDFKKKLIQISPLSDKYDEVISSKLQRAVNAVMKGSILIAVIQGVVSSIGFLIFGVPNPFLWGAVAAIGALIPGVGTTVVLVPVVMFLFFTVGLWPAVGLSIWGAVAVGLVDNFLGSKLVGQGIHFHPILAFLSVLGGIAFFGPVGFLFGPIIISLLFALVDIYLSLIRKSNEQEK
jgi:predicted PurR-regulated permease PerM